MRFHLASTLGLAALALTLAQPAAAQHAVGKGQQYYETICAKCHDASVGIGPALFGRGFTEQAYVSIARNGNRAMPAFRVSDIDDATLQELAHYLATTPPKK